MTLPKSHIKCLIILYIVVSCFSMHYSMHYSNKLSNVHLNLVRLAWEYTGVYCMLLECVYCMQKKIMHTLLMGLYYTLYDQSPLTHHSRIALYKLNTKKGRFLVSI